MVYDPSTVRRHLAKYHKPEYHAWAKEENFESKLSDDVKARKQAAEAAAAKEKFLRQQTLDSHLKEKPARPAAYTDELWLDAALDWLISTDQPIDALTNPKFEVMIDIAARATEGVTLTGRAQTRAEILKLFHEQMDKLKIRLHVSVQSEPLSRCLTLSYRAMQLRD
ncbi:hypothetical protein B0H17DRAFT_958304 [Mycena rosella]|uniref:Uncharacterized protein n=1 Tax=Mycena rosella TaxID=1033263 RepID=A0AAD7G3K4_MYCRO|nr:hypothetical protein B0H17DRAFT_958304 [Mycena rosella]